MIEIQHEIEILIEGGWDEISAIEEIADKTGKPVKEIARYYFEEVSDEISWEKFKEDYNII